MYELFARYSVVATMILLMLHLGRGYSECPQYYLLLELDNEIIGFPSLTPKLLDETAIEYPWFNNTPEYKTVAANRNCLIQLGCVNSITKECKPKLKLPRTISTHTFVSNTSHSEVKNKTFIESPIEPDPTEISITSTDVTSTDATSTEEIPAEETPTQETPPEETPTDETSTDVSSTDISTAVNASTAHSEANTKKDSWTTAVIITCIFGTIAALFLLTPKMVSLFQSGTYVFPDPDVAESTV